MGGAASGKFTVKSCGKAHAWCGVCRPEQAAAQRKAPAPPKVYVRPCRNCGRCDACLGLNAPEGMKVCRKCREAKPFSAFARRNDTGGYRNECMKCRNGHMKAARCEKCGHWFPRHADHRTLCGKCRPPLTKPCARCGTEFTGSMGQRRYCSPECRDAALKEKVTAARRSQRMEALLAYSPSGTPACECCGESTLTFLALDHVNGGGGKQHKELGGGGYYTWLRRNNYPEGFRVLCHNCNMGRQLNGGTCPHVEAG